MNSDPYSGLNALINIILIAGYLVILLGAYVLTSISLMLFFRKVGVAPWAGWVPIYSTWKWLEVGGQAGAWSLLSLVPYANIVPFVLLAMGMYRTGIAFRKPSGWVVLGIFLPWLWCLLLAGRENVYEPSLITAAGFPPPRAGFGSVPRTPGA
ncbi:DUF5684 domain-containing protein [Galbitalea soli]|uniref:Signal peptidase I n=1 Tax=Galbitalea soli TaxID=1268042 RepID=A0A7C9PLS2_9MICO|nr:DUF5684 domain-containing protein [Galbitalea soli]NEM90453.1 hypothetical protein [Galbitalea soli]NYJ31165.1 hypothetical protein [Galbitalea soli]